MIEKLLSPRKTLNKAYLKVKPTRSEIESFKNNLISLLDGLNESESEEHNKNDLGDFLKNTFYQPGYYINTKDRADLVIHTGPDSKSNPGVLIEVKKPGNKSEMVQFNNLKAKAFYELILYYLRERITNGNLEIKHLIATNVYEWFIFDSAVFERTFAQNKALVKQFTDFEEGRLSGSTTDFFYNSIAEPFVIGIEEEFPFTWFDFRDYDKPLRNAYKVDDAKLIALFKVLSPEHLLKLPFSNDSNSLDKAFYAELLHIIGLTETKEGSKKLIGRKKEGDRNSGSLIESAVLQLDNLDKISRLEKPAQFGETFQERLFNVALELSITWINRILFLKLLEAQLIRYHKGDPSYAFLNCEKVQNFDDLNTLFFGVLARVPADRSEEVRKLYTNVPYLNSSLFEPTSLEHSCLFISQLKDGKLPILNSTVLKDNNGKKLKGELFTLEHLFKFLDAYDFAGEGSEEIQEENKTLINASVLGLIFEKINGYKDGSFFTPGFITMYMCRETIRRAVLQKFREVKGWECGDLNELYNKLTDLQDANKIMNTMKICDPAVGSGHFLVSALNEIIAIKSELKILTDKEGKRLKEYQLEVVNDELMMTDEDGDLFEYNPSSPESQRVQETLFKEKQTIIENCLFGVDVNPNSVKICRLRLWIELLKNAYYKPESGFTELETLPNIDINIKCGNSLISRYALDADIKQALKKSKWSIDSYRLAVMSYRNASSKEEKRTMERLIESIKSDFETEVAANDKRLVQLKKMNGDLFNLTNQTELFALSKKEKTEWDKKVKDLTVKIRKIEAELEEIKNNKIYENAFEWRFEFPEVLNDDGDFVGFDVVIGNPPYILIQNINDKSLFDYFKGSYYTAKYKIDTYHLFFELGYSLLKRNSFLSYISPNTFLKNKFARNLRELLLQNRILEIINFYIQVFEDASVDTLILFSQKCYVIGNQITFIPFKEGSNEIPTSQRSYHMQSNFERKELEFEFDIASNDVSIFEKLDKIAIPLNTIGRAYFGIQTYDRKKFVSTTKVNDDYYPVIDGTNVKRYYYDAPKEYVLFKNEAIKSGGDVDVYNKERIVVRQIGVFPQGTIIEPNTLTLNTIYNIFLFKDDIPLEFILGLINSKLISFFWTKKYYDNKATFPKIKKAPLESIPIVEFGGDKSLILTDLVKKVLRSKMINSITDTSGLEKEIDQLVYELYSLTEEEIKIVEDSVGQ
jgi:adenine-specific DNA-methyltransferase